MPPKMAAGFSTRAIHAGHSPESHHGAVSTPIFMSSTFCVDDIQDPTGGHLYGRFSNPTRGALETCFATMENAKYGNQDACPFDCSKNVLL